MYSLDYVSKYSQQSSEEFISFPYRLSRNELKIFQIHRKSIPPWLREPLSARRKK